jgi:tryptophan synthase beta subunit
LCRVEGIIPALYSAHALAEVRAGRLVHQVKCPGQLVRRYKDIDIYRENFQELDLD